MFWNLDEFYRESENSYCPCVGFPPDPAVKRVCKKIIQYYPSILGGEYGHRAFGHSCFEASLLIQETICAADISDLYSIPNYPFQILIS